MPEMTKQQQRERVKRRVGSADTSNHTYYPEKENNQYVKTDAFQLVGIYARVSTDNPAQTSSFELQQKYYEDMVSRNPNWKLVKIYSDEGKSGTTIQQRPGFQEMIDDAVHEKLHLIIVKNISRFARNTVECLSTLRKLRAKKVGVYFESEGIYSLNSDCHIALSTSANLAEHESRLRSRSMETSLRMRLDHGLPLTPELLGFVKNEDGKLIVNKDTRNIPKLMFFMYLYGYSTQQIADILIKLSKRSYLGNIKWTASGVARTLRNERYCGDVLTRKRFKEFAPDVDKQKTFKNTGEKPQSYYKDDHQRIISHDDFIAVQRIMNNARFGGTSLLPELRVIPEGLLKGFVIVHPKWGSFTKEDYINACKSVDTDIYPNVTEAAGEADTFDLRGYEIADFKLFDDQNIPAVTLGPKEIRFNQTCISNMSSGNYVELLIHPLKKELAIRPTTQDNRYAVQWSKGSKKNGETRGIACKAFINTMFEIMGWNIEYRYKLYGCIYHDEKDCAGIFSNMDSSILINKEEYLSNTDMDSPEKLLGVTGKCVRAVSGNFANNFGQEYYIEKSRRELFELTKEQWQTRIEGQMCSTGEKLNVTPYEELRNFIKQELGELFEEEDINECS
ncbi:recombinase family protein [Ruminococcus flavefaciens]|uniref:recombinase family protein n=1 Tax=Ruminococcus flavefaciens TaxID=1265 RepID=UPI0026E9ACEC|nr:recombinase family protein [Ruminococcus flavefaciens]